MSNDRDLKRLLWQCRRGLNEVEVILLPFLEQHYCNLSQAEQKTFERLLQQTDMDLFEWFTGRSEADEADFIAMVDTILASRKR